MTNKTAMLRERSGWWHGRASSFWSDVQPRSSAGRTSRAVSDFEVKVYRSITLIEQAEWDSLCGSDAVTRSHAYLSAVEAAAIAGFTHFYLRVFDSRGRAIAQAPLYILVTDFGQLLPNILQPLLARCRVWWPALLTARITECATPLFSGPALSPPEVVHDHSVMSAIEAAVTDLAQAKGSRLIVFRDFYRSDIDSLQWLKPRGYKCVNNLPLARIGVEWATYNDYLAGMRSRYRKDLRRRMRKAERLGQSVQVLDNFAADARGWERQAAVIYRQAAGFKREAVNADYYRQMNHALGEACKLLVVMCEGRAIAHGMVAFDDENAVATFFGRESGPANGEWFLLMNEVVRLGIERQCRYIHLGLGSYDAKALVGAVEEPLFVYTRCTHRLLNWLIRRVPDLMKRPPVKRNRPFRSDGE